MGFVRPPRVLLSEVPKCLSQLRASVSLSKLFSFSSPARDPPFSLPEFPSHPAPPFPKCRSASLSAVPQFPRLHEGSVL